MDGWMKACLFFESLFYDYGLYVVCTVTFCWWICSVAWLFVMDIKMQDFPDFFKCHMQADHKLEEILLS